jgi:hypothetical protein
MSGRFDELLQSGNTGAALGLSSALASTLNGAGGGGGNRTGSSEKAEKVHYKRFVVTLLVQANQGTIVQRLNSATNQ